MSFQFSPRRFDFASLSPIFSRVLDAFQTIGEKPYIYGGSLRDEVLGIPHNDIDLRLSFDEKSLDRDLEYLPTLMRNSDFFNMVSSNVQVLGGTYLRVRICADFYGHTLDIVQDNIELSVPQVLQLSDAPINSAVIDPNDRGIKAHPDFLNHVRSKLYAPFHVCDEDRFSHLRARIEGLRLVT